MYFVYRMLTCFCTGLLIPGCTGWSIPCLMSDIVLSGNAIFVLFVLLPVVVYRPLSGFVL